MEVFDNNGTTNSTHFLVSVWQGCDSCIHFHIYQVWGIASFIVVIGPSTTIRSIDEMDSTLSFYRINAPRGVHGHKNYTMKRLWLIGVLCAALLNPAVAQRKQISRDFVKGTEFDLINIPGTERCSYVVGEDGSNIKDGPYSIKCNLSSTQVSVWPYTFTINGSYTVNANFSKGRLNGTLTSSFQMPLSKYRVSTGTERQTLSQTFSGNFVNGVPNGTIVVSYNNLETRGKLVATYRNGVLTGAFSWYNDGLKPGKISGTAPSVNGKLSGTWTFENGLGKRTLQFQNGVLISTTVVSQSRLNPGNRSTRPAYVELAKKYASGSITKEELLKRNIVVRSDSIYPGNTARAAIFEKSGVNFAELGGYDFSISNTFGYEYLEEIPFLSDEGLGIIIEKVREWAMHDQNSFGDLALDYINKDSLIYDNFVAMDKKGPYVIINGNNPSSRRLVTCEMPPRHEKIYIPMEQFDKINMEAHKVLAESAQSLVNYVRGITLISALPDRNLTTLAKEHASIVRKYNAFKAIASPCKYDADYVVVQKEPGVRPVYVTQSSVTEYEHVMKTYEEELIKGFEAGGVAPEVAKKIIDRGLAVYMSSFASLCNYLVEAKKPFNIEYGDHASDYFYQPHENDLSGKIKPFCPIAACRIVDVNDNASVVTLEISKEVSKKKSNLTYRVPVRTGNGRIDVNSIDFTKAQQVD